MARKRKRKAAHKKRRKAKGGHKRKRKTLMPESVIRRHAHKLKRNKRALKIYKEVIG